MAYSSRTSSFLINAVCAAIVLLNGIGAFLGLKGPLMALWNAHRVAVILGAPLLLLAYAALLVLGVSQLQAERSQHG
jgi:hypothetical protein